MDYMQKMILLSDYQDVCAEHFSFNSYECHQWDIDNHDDDFAECRTFAYLGCRICTRRRQAMRRAGEL